MLLLTGAGLVAIGIAPVRRRLASLFGGTRETLPTSPHAAEPETVEEQIEIDVPVSTAYNQWTQFEEFPKFMEGVERVEQLDDTLLHWVGTVAGKRAEWDAKILEQEPDRRISWKSVGGKETQGTVTFEEAGPSRTKVRLQMRYQPEGLREKVGSIAGLDKRRIRGDLERFQELVERRGDETGAWRGEIHQGEVTGGDAWPPASG
ncbi:MAG: SRPBCC family protein [Actinobacteria bacterium]|nr:SRPBCC family protein [Actinomycetota bacterium]